MKLLIFFSFLIIGNTLCNQKMTNLEKQIEETQKKVSLLKPDGFQWDEIKEVLKNFNNPQLNEMAQNISNLERGANIIFKEVMLSSSAFQKDNENQLSEEQAIAEFQKAIQKIVLIFGQIEAIKAQLLQAFIASKI